MPFCTCSHSSVEKLCRGTGFMYAVLSRSLAAGTKKKVTARKHLEILSPNVYQREERLEQITYLRTSGETETKYSNVKTGYFHTQQGLCCQRGLAGHFFSTSGMLMLDFLEFIHDQGMRQFLLEDGISSNFIKSILRQARRRS